jgi:ethanolamine utilization microcompartment shell protein EutS
MESGKRFLVVTPDKIALAVVNPDRDVVIHVDLDKERTGLLGIELMIRMTPTEARQFAEALVRKAGEAAVGFPRA